LTNCAKSITPLSCQGVLEPGIYLARLVNAELLSYVNPSRTNYPGLLSDEEFAAAKARIAPMQP